MSSGDLPDFGGDAFAEIAPATKLATALLEDPPLRTLDVDGSLHFSHLKRIARSGQQFLREVNKPTRATTAMMIGSVVHILTLGARPGKLVLRYDGKSRATNEYKAFRAKHPDDAEILTAPEWDLAERIAESVLADPLAIDRLAGARFETPLEWEELGIRCSTSGVDILTASPCALGDLKTTRCAEPEAWQRDAFRMYYPQQLAWYQRGCRANGIAVPGGLFLLGVETVEPFEVVDLDLTERMIDFADSSVALMLERFKSYRDAVPSPRTFKDWPGYAQSRIAFDVPSWMQDDDENEDEEEAA